MAQAVKAKDLGQGGTFRILVGVRHFGDGPEGCECQGCFHGDPLLRGKNHVYESYQSYARRRQNEKAKNPEDQEPILPEAEYTGDLIESKSDMERHNGKGNLPQFKKFERVVEGGPQFQAAPAPFPLERMTFAQLLAVAEEEGIDVPAAARASKAELLACIQAHRGATDSTSGD